MLRPAMGERYSRVAILFHWTIAALVIVNLVIGVGHDAVPALRAALGAHKAIGITVLALTLVRLAWRLGHRPPALPASVPLAERRIAATAHWLLYALLVAMPLSGWIMVSGPDGRHPLSWFGLFPIPFLPVSAHASDTGFTVHSVLGWGMLVLVVIHILAALRHHLLLRDATLERMAPVLARR